MNLLHWSVRGALVLGVLGAPVLGVSSCSSSGGDSEQSTATPIACASDKDCREQDLLCETSRRVCVECLNASHCGDDELCVADRCVGITPCTSSRDCGSDEVCSDALGRCVQCVSDADCPDEEVCAGEVCRAACQSDKDCQAFDLLCEQTQGYCVDCTAHDDCSSTQYCNAAGACVDDACEAGNAQCEDDDLVLCNAEGSGFTSNPCINGCVSDDGAAHCKGEPVPSTGTGGSPGNEPAEAGSSSTEGGAATASGGSNSGGTDSQGGTPPTTGGNGASGAATTGGADGEAGSASTGGSGGDPGNGCGTTRTLPVTFRDFAPTHPDFLPVSIGELITGIVEPELNAEQKPVLAGASNALAHIASSASFAEWYTDGANRATIPGEIVLFDDGAGGYVNRYGANGERWQFWDELEVCQIAGNACADCTVPAGSTCLDPCPESFLSGGTLSCYGISTELDGNPLFFPIDGHPDALTDTQGRAKLPPEYGGIGWPWEDAFLGGAQKLHNFLFTTEIHVNFTYHADRSQRFDFLGDDDLWVFLNGQLIIDLGGWHVPLAGSFTIDEAIAESYDLTDGEEYEISVFHAERQPEGSSFMMRLEGFQDCE